MPRYDGSTMHIDVDRLGVVGLHSTARLLDQLPLARPDCPPPPRALVFKCSHLVSRDPPVTPTFPSRHPSDRRLREAKRLRAGEALVKAFCRHIAHNSHLLSLEVLSAPLRLFDFQQLAAGLLHNGCQLRHLDLTGSRLGDAGLAAFGPTLLTQHKLVFLSLSGCGTRLG